MDPDRSRNLPICYQVPPDRRRGSPKDAQTDLSKPEGVRRRGSVVDRRRSRRTGDRDVTRRSSTPKKFGRGGGKPRGRTVGNRLRFRGVESADAADGVNFATAADKYAGPNAVIRILTSGVGPGRKFKTAVDDVTPRNGNRLPRRGATAPGSDRRGPTVSADPNARLHPDKSCPDGYVPLPEDLRDWIVQEGVDVASIVRMARLRSENPDVWRRCVLATDDDVGIAILEALVYNRGTATYRDLEDRIDASLRTIRRRLDDLVQDGVVDVGDGRPPIVAFSTEAAAVLAEDALTSFHPIYGKKVLQDLPTNDDNEPDQQPAKWTNSVRIGSSADGDGDVDDADPLTDPFAHVEVDDPGHPVEFETSTLPSD